VYLMRDKGFSRQANDSPSLINDSAVVHFYDAEDDACACNRLIQRDRRSLGCSVDSFCRRRSAITDGPFI